jgi:hypothetical protein
MPFLDKLNDVARASSPCSAHGLEARATESDLAVQRFERDLRGR